MALRRLLAQHALCSHSHPRSPHAHPFQVHNSHLVCAHTNTQTDHTGTVEFVSAELFSASRKINVLLSKMSCRPHKSLLLGSCALPPPTLPHYSSKGDMQRVIIIRQGQITGLGGEWLHSIKGRFLGNKSRCWEAGVPRRPTMSGHKELQARTQPLGHVQQTCREPRIWGSSHSNPNPGTLINFAFQAHTQRKGN